MDLASKHMFLFIYHQNKYHVLLIFQNTETKEKIYRGYGRSNIEDEIFFIVLDFLKKKSKSVKENTLK